MTDPVPHRYRRLGVIGGLGPEATARLYRFIVDRCVAAAPTRYPDIVVHSVPVSFAVEDAFVRGHPTSRHVADIVEQLVESAQLLISVGVDLILLPCNSLHTVVAKVIAILGPHAPTIVDMPFAAATLLAGFDRVLVLGTGSTRGLNIYGPLVDPKVHLDYPRRAEQLLVEELILRATRSRGTSVSADLACVVKAAAPRPGAVLLACTDLDNMESDALDGLPVVGSLRALGELAVAELTRSVTRSGDRALA
jgi:aspartate racemase